MKEINSFIGLGSYESSHFFDVPALRDGRREPLAALGVALLVLGRAASAARTRALLPIPARNGAPAPSARSGPETHNGSCFFQCPGPSGHAIDVGEDDLAKQRDVVTEAQQPSVRIAYRHIHVNTVKYVVDCLPREGIGSCRK